MGYMGREYKRIEGFNIFVKEGQVEQSPHGYKNQPHKTVYFRMDSDPLNSSFESMRQDMMLFERDVAKYITKLEAEGCVVLYKSEPEYESESSYYDSFNYYMSAYVSVAPNENELRLFEAKKEREKAHAKAQRKFDYEKLKKEFENDCQ